MAEQHLSIRVLSAVLSTKITDPDIFVFFVDRSWTYVFSFLTHFHLVHQAEFCFGVLLCSSYGATYPFMGALAY